jgi:hypothetical protein
MTAEVGVSPNRHYRFAEARMMRLFLRISNGRAFETAPIFLKPCFPRTPRRPGFRRFRRFRLSDRKGRRRRTFRGRDLASPLVPETHGPRCAAAHKPSPLPKPSVPRTS